MDFLSDVLDGNGKEGAITPFAECILLATLYGRCMSHRRLSIAAALSNPGSEPHEFWARHESLAAAVEKRRLSIAHNFRSPSGGDRNATAALVPISNLDLDPMLTFTYILAESAVIYLSMATETSMWKTVEHQLMALTYEQRAFQATAELVRLAKVIPRLGRFKVKPNLNYIPFPHNSPQSLRTTLGTPVRAYCIVTSCGVSHDPQQITISGKHWR